MGRMGWEVGGRFKREGTYVYLWLIHVDIWQKPTQFCKAIILLLKINTLRKNTDFYKSLKKMKHKVFKNISLRMCSSGFIGKEIMPFKKCLLFNRSNYWY